MREGKKNSVGLGQNGIVMVSGKKEGRAGPERYILTKR